MKWILSLFLIAAIASSCGKKCPCEEESVGIAYVGYTASELDTIIIQKFTKGSNFTQRADSFALISANVIYSTFGGDTTIIGNARFEQRISKDFDWRITNPFDNKSVQISEIIAEAREERCGGLFGWDGHPCISPIISFNKNGIPSSFSRNDFYHGIFIHK